MGSFSKGNFIFQAAFFRGHVNFRGGEVDRRTQMAVWLAPNQHVTSHPKIRNQLVARKRMALEFLDLTKPYKTGTKKGEPKKKNNGLHEDVTNIFECHLLFGMGMDDKEMAKFGVHVVFMVGKLFVDLLLSKSDRTTAICIICCCKFVKISEVAASFIIFSHPAMVDCQNRERFVEKANADRDCQIICPHLPPHSLSTMSNLTAMCRCPCVENTLSNLGVSKNSGTPK